MDQVGIVTYYVEIGKSYKKAVNIVVDGIRNTRKHKGNRTGKICCLPEYRYTSIFISCLWHVCKIYMEYSTKVL